ncbi:MAG: DNA alkylation repair protein, partial [Chloroflexi bacterium]|nr:DNA alkylation repair protein [Chloroflexota bacterium]
HQLETWTHNKAIQKAIESRRICPTTKAELRALRRKP